MILAPPFGRRPGAGAHPLPPSLRHCYRCRNDRCYTVDEQKDFCHLERSYLLLLCVIGYNVVKWSRCEPKRDLLYFCRNAPIQYSANLAWPLEVSPNMLRNHVNRKHDV